MKDKGITLVALVITIIVMLILAAVSINFVIDENGIINRAKEARDSTIAAQKNEEDFYSEVDSYADEVLIEGYDTVLKVNKPKLDTGMIPVYYDETNKIWRKADENNAGNQWYDYSTKKWANIVTVSDEVNIRENYREAAVGEPIPMEDITTFFVWIPRYAYSIYEGYQMGNAQNGKIDITFLNNNTNKGFDGTEYPTDYDETILRPGDVTPKIVHPGFTFGDKELTGIWVGKYEASIENEEFIILKPSVESWLGMSTGEAQYQSMRMSENTSKYGWSTLVDSHLIKNIEWGAVAYLCYSQYGVVPQGNNCSSYITGAGPSLNINEEEYSEFDEEINGYSSSIGILASTTGNIYGIYDMNGGCQDKVAAYLDNGAYYLNRGNSYSNGDFIYFENGVLKPQYSKYWDKYEKGDPDNLENNYLLMAKHKGIGVNETAISDGYTWDGTRIESPYTYRPFIFRGYYGGILSCDSSEGLMYFESFRPTLGF